jgi:hypothetical protein
MLDAPEPAAASPSRYRRPSVSWWKGPVVAACVLVVAGLVTVLAWPYIHDAFQVPAQPVAQGNNNTPDVPKDPPPPDKPLKPPTDKPAADKPAPTKPASDKPPTDKPAPNKPPTDKPTTDKTPPDKPNPKPDDPPKGAPPYPRRALIISVHNYLYANPVHAGMPIAGARNIPHFLDALNKGLHIPMTEMAHLSDAAEKGQARAPMKPVIQKTLTDFLETSRAQDHILVFFIGHAVAVGDDAYLVPIEGELDNADTLIPLKWVYEQMEKCKARQKVLVIDVNRLNPAHGLERPNGGPMDAKVDAALNAPPDGVQVWTACVAGQQSYELDEEPMGVFLDKLNTALAPGKGEKGMEGKIQHPEDPLPLDALQGFVNASLKEELNPYKLEQQSRLAGAEPKDGAAFNRSEAPAPTPTLAPAGSSGNPKEIQAVLNEIGAPPIKASREDSTIRFEVLPPFPAAIMSNYPAGSPDDDHKALRDAILNAREVIWAINTAAPPAPVSADVQKKRMELKANLSILKDGYRKPADENAFKNMVMKDEREVADLMAACDDAVNLLKAAGEKRDTDIKRWQVNYDFTLARLEAQYAYLFEYQSMLGQMRKQLPDLAPGQNGWKLASLETLKGDSQGKNLAKSARKLFDQIIKDNPSTPWEVLAKREKLTALGLKWEGTKSE